MNGFTRMLASLQEIGFLIVRVVTGAILAVHGYQKVFDMGVGNVAGFFDKIGIPIAQVSAPFISFLELLGGLLLIVGLVTRYLGVLYTIEFIVATWAVAGPMGKGINGAHLEVMLLLAGVLLATHGGGKLSLDHMVGIERD